MTFDACNAKKGDGQANVMTHVQPLWEPKNRIAPASLVRCVTPKGGVVAEHDTDQDTGKESDEVSSAVTAEREPKVVKNKWTIMMTQ